jgi:hypothetical protein
MCKEEHTPEGYVLILLCETKGKFTLFGL